MRSRLDRLDIGVGSAVIVLVLTIAITISRGDRAGVGVADVQPLSAAHTTSLIRVAFNELMDQPSVESRFTIEPKVGGTFAWSGTQLTFRPGKAFTAGQRYQITILAGADSRQGRHLTEDVRWSFVVQQPRLVYLAPAIPEQQSEPPNLWLVDPTKPFEIRQLTTTRYGVLDFQSSPDGTQVAYAQKASDSTTDLYALNVDTGNIQRLTNCVNAICRAPSWSPDGLRIAYERVELGAPASGITSLNGAGGTDTPDNGSPGNSSESITRAWILSLKDLSTTPLIADRERLGQLPRWSADGTQIAVYDRSLHGIAVYNLANGDRKLITSFVEDSGWFNPAGTRLVFPDLIQTPSEFYNNFSIADLANPQYGIRSLAGRDDAPVDDHQAAWAPDGTVLAITRRYLDQTAVCNPQIYLINPSTAEAQPLVVDGTYAHGALGWSPGGDQLAFQRYACTEDNAEPGIWVYSLATRVTTQVARNGFLPAWLP